MAHKIQIKRGNKADLPTLDVGEFGLCQDTNELFIGNNGNQKIFPPTAPTISDVEGLQTALDNKVDNSRVLTNVPVNAKFTDTTYSEISTSEIDAGTSSTLRTITGRRVKYLLDKVQGWINALTKSDIGLGDVENYSIATQSEAESGTANNRYMTPLGTKQAINMHNIHESSHQDIRQQINDLDADIIAHKADYAKHSARIYNAANYGLDGEGINAAITDAYNNGGGTVIIDGIFNVDDESIILKPNVSLVGLPGNKINLTNREISIDEQPYEFNCVIEGLNLGHEDTTALTSIIRIGGLDAANKCSNVIIRDNVIKCNERGNNTISITYTEKIEIYNNTIYDSGQGSGILINNSLNVDVYNNKVYNSGRAGIQVFANCEYIRIHDNYVYSWMLRRDITDGGIDSYGPYNSHISVYNNIVDTGTTQAMGGAKNHLLFRMQGVHGCYVKNNILIVQSPTVGQVMRVSERDESEISDGVVFEGNEIYLKTDAQYIFRGQKTKDWTIRNNKVYSLGGVCLNCAIEVRGNIEELLVDGNEFKDNLTRPLIVVYPTGVKLSNLRIINNTFINQSQRLLMLLNIDYPVDTVMICNNRIETSLGDAIYVYPGIGKLMVTNNYVQCGEGGTPITNKGTLGEGNEIIENNFEVVSSS